MQNNMRESEAIKLLEERIAFVGTMYSVMDDYKTALAMSIKALEKQQEMKEYCKGRQCESCNKENNQEGVKCINDFIADD